MIDRMECACPLRRQGMRRNNCSSSSCRLLENLQCAAPGQSATAIGICSPLTNSAHDPHAAAFRQDCQAGPGFRRDRNARKHGDQSMAPAADQERPARSAFKMLQKILQARHVAGPGGEKGQRGGIMPAWSTEATSATARTAWARPISAMGDPSGRLGECNARRRGGFARPRAGFAAQGAAQSLARGDAAGRWQWRATPGKSQQVRTERRQRQQRSARTCRCMGSRIR